MTSISALRTRPVIACPTEGNYRPAMTNEQKDADFEVVGGKPTVVEVRSSDGKVYTIRGVVTILRIVEEVGVTTPDGNPLFHVTANFVLNTEPKPGKG